MFITANLSLGLANLVNLVFNVYMLLIIIRVVLSWVPHDRYNQIIRFIYDSTEPALSRIREFIPPIAGLDLTPMILIFIIYIIKQIVISILI
ncbi:YggT family protein [candidate division KSB1 bacterium]|nr:YggT family protein [candidate division KSB1 bacterium]